MGILNFEFLVLDSRSQFKIPNSQFFKFILQNFSLFRNYVKIHVCLFKRFLSKLSQSRKICSGRSKPLKKKTNTSGKKNVKKLPTISRCLWREYTASPVFSMKSGPKKKPKKISESAPGGHVSRKIQP